MDNKHDDTVGEELSAFGQRVKGATKDAVGAVTGNRSLEREGERENAQGRARQATNNVMDETDSVRRGHRRLLRICDRPLRFARKRQSCLSGPHRDARLQSRRYDVLMTDETRARHFGDAKPGTELSGGTKAAEGFGKGSAIGGGVGAALAAIFAVGTSVVVPDWGSSSRGPLRRPWPAPALAGRPGESSAR